MKNQPKNLDCSKFISYKLLQVCVGENEMILRFQDDNLKSLTITIEATFCIILPNTDSEQCYDRAPAAAGPISNFLGNTITNSLYDGGNGTFFIIFDSGGQMSIKNSFESYESYSIHFNGDVFVV